MNSSTANVISTATVITDFAHIRTIRLNTCTIFQDIKQKLLELNKIYMDIVKNHAVKEYTFGLDAFHFQSKLIEYEYENMQKLLNIITNRCYCEYYKLYKIISDYVHNEIKITVNLTNKNTFPIYKDLDKNINYDFGLTIEIQAIIIKYITAVDEYLQVKNKELKINNARQYKCGINIEHIVHYQSFTSALISEQIMMFIRYMDALNKHHTKYITRIYTISKALIDDMNSTITTNNNDGDNEYEIISLDENDIDENDIDENESGENESGENESGENESGKSVSYKSLRYDSELYQSNSPHDKSLHTTSAFRPIQSETTLYGIPSKSITPILSRSSPNSSRTLSATTNKPNIIHTIKPILCIPTDTEQSSVKESLDDDTIAIENTGSVIL